MRITKKVLKPFLFISLGLVLTTIVFASVRAPYDVSSAPGTPVLTSQWSDGCGLEYTKPIHDGGTPIMYYIVESAAAGEQWIKKGTFRGLNCQVNGMRKGVQVVFRVSAVNNAGVSAPSENSEFIMF